jgi:hypothetical protein
MQDMAAVALLTGLLLAGGTILWYIGVDHFERLKRRTNSCSCECAYDLTSIEAQHTKYYVHERTVCQPKREWIAR